MSIYGYRCQICGDMESQRRADSIICPYCHGVAKRLFQWTNASVLQSHYNPAFGQVISSRKQAAELAKKASDDQSQRLGMTVDYQLTDIHDHEAAGIDRAEAKDMAAQSAAVQSKWAH